MQRMIDHTGEQFGRLTVIEYAGKNKHGQPMWRCRCDCGKEITVRADGLTTGHTKSCGCYKSDIHATHRMKNTRLYDIWRGMKKRVGLKTLHNYEEYGGRGITACQEWLDSFEVFRDWAMENGYRDDLSLDRIDNDGPYSPENCRWATQKEQNNNKRNNHVVTYEGKEMTVTQLAEITGIERHTLYRRLNSGWDVEKAVSTPVQKRKTRKGDD